VRLPEEQGLLEKQTEDKPSLWHTEEENEDKFPQEGRI
jgi:hypothetical protein